MESRRKFLKASAAALTVAATRPLVRASRAPTTGSGWRSSAAATAAAGCSTRSRGRPDCQCLAAAEVNKAQARLVDDAGAPDLQARRRRRLPPHPRPQGHRRGADRARPTTGTPADDRRDLPPARTSTSRSRRPTPSPRINAMLDAYKKGKQVVQVGTQQRSWDHFIEAKKLLDSGVLGNVTHVIIVQPGSYARPKEAEAAGAGRARLGHVAGAGAEEAVQAEPARVPRLVRLRRRPGRRLGRAPRRRRALVHERRPQGADQDRRRTARSSRCPTPIRSRCPTRSRSPGSTTTSS